MKDANPLKDLEMARRVQQALLQVSPPSFPNITIAKRCIPASHLGGDFYTFIGNTSEVLTQNPKTPGVITYERTTQNFLGVAIGDVAGHGVPSALVMALSSGLLEKIAQTTTSPSLVLEKANDDLFKFISNSDVSHVTAFYAVLNCQTKHLAFAKAGHHPALLISKDRLFTELDTPGVFLGMFENEKYEEKSIQLEAGDRILFYTDGLIETQDPSGEEYGLERLKECLEKNQALNAEDALASLFESVNTFRQNPAGTDDQTAVILEVH